MMVAPNYKQNKIIGEKYHEWMMCTNKSNNVKLNNSLKGALHKMDMIKDIKGYFKKGTNY